jgi:hypothetical protein
MSKKPNLKKCKKKLLGKRRFFCEECKKNYSGPSGLWYHEKHVHLAETKSYSRNKLKIVTKVKAKRAYASARLEARIRAARRRKVPKLVTKKKRKKIENETEYDSEFKKKCRKLKQPNVDKNLVVFEEDLVGRICRINEEEEKMLNSGEFKEFIIIDDADAI